MYLCTFISSTIIYAQSKVLFLFDLSSICTMFLSLVLYCVRKRFKLFINNSLKYINRLLFYKILHLSPLPPLSSFVHFSITSSLLLFNLPCVFTK